MSAPEDHLLAAQRAAEERLELCTAVLYDQEEADGVFALEDPSSAPFCGCTTCEVREVLDAAYPHIRAHVLAEDS